VEQARQIGTSVPEQVQVQVQVDQIVRSRVGRNSDGVEFLHDLVLRVDQFGGSAVQRGRSGRRTVRMEKLLSLWWRSPSGC